MTAAAQQFLPYHAPLILHARGGHPGAAMALDSVSTGKDVPNEINVIIEIPKDAEPVKYEVDKASGAIFVDRVLSTPMRYPCNYGYVPQTLGGDGDPLDVLVILPLPLVPGSVIRCVPVGVLRMTDEAGSDEKLVAVPVPKVFEGYSHITDISQVSLARPHRPFLRALGPRRQVGEDRRLGEREGEARILAGVERYHRRTAMT